MFTKHPENHEINSRCLGGTIFHVVYSMCFSLISFLSFFFSQCIDFSHQTARIVKKEKEKKKKNGNRHTQPHTLFGRLSFFFLSSFIGQRYKPTHTHTHISRSGTYQVRKRRKEGGDPYVCPIRTHIGWQSAEADGWTQMMMASPAEQAGRGTTTTTTTKRKNDSVDWMFNPLDVY